VPPVDPKAVRARSGPDPTDEAARRKMMANSRGRDTAIELALRRELHARGLRFRVGAAVRVPGRKRAIRPDVVWSGLRLAVFLDGCFWHACPVCGRAPKSNVDYWGPKLARNVERDAAQAAAMREAGWTVLRFYEHDLRNDLALVADLVHVSVRALRGT
jgi:DNA mismatch endonuclease (patch repair protein)